MATEEEKWYVMKAANNRALSTKREILDPRSIVSFVPMKQSLELDRRGVKQWRTTPIFSNLVFVKTTQSTLWQLDQAYPHLYASYDRTLGNIGKQAFITIPTETMEEFIAFVEDNISNLKDVDVADLNLKKGEKVRVTSGAFEGRIATLVSVKGKRSKQIVTVIDGYVAVMATCDFTVERIEA